MKLHFSEETATGKVRKVNEDCCGNHYNEVINGHLFCLADGMGGYEAGRKASRIVVNSVLKDFSLLTKRDLDPETLVLCFFNNAQNRLHHYKNNHNISRLGTTLAILLFCNHTIICANVGDTRIYSYSNNQVVQESFDHSVVGELVQSRKITREEALHHPRQHVLTMALTGDNNPVSPHLKNLNHKTDNTFLLASDGLYKMVEDNEIARIISSSNLEEAGNKLLQGALKNGGKDNITLQIISLRNH